MYVFRIDREKEMRDKTRKGIKRGRNEDSGKEKEREKESNQNKRTDKEGLKVK